jgi:hypothetical protein
MVVQGSLNFGGEQTMVNLRARPWYCTNKAFYTERSNWQLQQSIGTSCISLLALALRSKAQVSESQQPSCKVQKGGTLKKPTPCLGGFLECARPRASRDKRVILWLTLGCNRVAQPTVLL